MKVAIPVTNDSLHFFSNAGHAPFFAIFAMKGNGMFRSFALQEVRKNPRNDLEGHHHDDDDHECSHGHDDAEHIRQHDVMAESLEDCDYLITRRACKNTAKSMANLGIKIKKYNDQATSAKEILSTVSGELT